MRKYGGRAIGSVMLNGLIILMFLRRMERRGIFKWPRDRQKNGCCNVIILRGVDHQSVPNRFLLFRWRAVSCRR